MKTSSLNAIFDALSKAGAKYLVMEGVAVIAHGYQRFTRDLDLVLDFSSDSLQAALHALHSLGYRPRIPVEIFDFAKPELRKQWQEEKGLKVFNVFSSEYPDVTIDLFPESPFDFEEEYRRAIWHELGTGIRIPVASIAQLIAMKMKANRPQDQTDIDKLKKIQQLSHEA